MNHIFVNVSLYPYHMPLSRLPMIPIDPRIHPLVQLEVESVNTYTLKAKKFRPMNLGQNIFGKDIFDVYHGISDVFIEILSD